MKYQNFKNNVQDWPVISIAHLLAMVKDKPTCKNQISYWKKQGFIVPLKKGLYVLNARDRRINPSREYIANQLVFPSYISLEYALSFYGLIPEKAYQVTCITAKKTAEFTNIFGTFSYRNLKNELIFGFEALKDENNMQILMAEKEKAVLDFLYLNLSDLQAPDPDLLSASYRIETREDLDNDRMFAYCERFHSKKLTKWVDKLFKNG